MTDKAKDVLRETDAQSIRLAKSLIRGSRYGALAVIDPISGAPLASRVGVATDLDGAPLILVSMLAAHTPAILADPRCSLMLGEAGKGDPLAHPRISIRCQARKLEAGSPDEVLARRRYLNRQPKAKLYAGLGDFHLFRLEMEGASLNGGFGRAYSLASHQLTSAIPEGLADYEQSALDHMNSDHIDAIQLYAKHLASAENRDWRISGFDAEGLDLLDGDNIARVWFPEPLLKATDLRKVLVQLASDARRLAV